MSTYNGWANYATWRINLELFDGLSTHDFSGTLSATALAGELKEYLFSYLEDESKGLALDYAMAFCGDVDFHEIASHMLAEYEIEAA